MTNDELKTKSQLLLALGVGWECSPVENQQSILDAIEKVTLELVESVMTKEQS